MVPPVTKSHTNHFFKFIINVSPKMYLHLSKIYTNEKKFKHFLQFCSNNSCWVCNVLNNNQSDLIKFE